jgi:hypothetical protein
MSQNPPPSRSAPSSSGWLAAAWQNAREFSGGGATMLWPRWIVLRAVGVVYLFVFAGILREGQALVGPRGIAPLAEFFAALHRAFPFPPEALVRAPSLFWFGTGATAITVLTWVGLLAAAALVLNLWPRMALACCWLVFVSFVTTWRVFTAAQLDRLMLETALLLIPFAPAGFRPGLGAASPPRPIAILMVRWLLFRVMFESGLVKLVAGDPHWRNWSAMEVMYETNPFPTILSYLDFQLPRAYHVLEIVLTFAAELAGPLLAVFAGRRGRWFAFWSWAALQAGIQLTSNFGWLNTAAIGLGVLLLDDAMLLALVTRLRLPALGRFLAVQVTAPAVSAARGFRLHGLRVALWAHFYLTLFFFAKACGVPMDRVPYALTWPVHLLWEFRSANGYYLYASFDPVRYQVEFEGSNDGGRTWRTYEYRYMPQREDRLCPFLAPWFARFEATVEISGWVGKKSPLMPAVAAHLLACDPAVVGLFQRDPFPDSPPTLLRMRGYRLFFTDRATQRQTGKYWRKEPAGNYLPMLYLDETGRVLASNLAAAEEALHTGDNAAAVKILEHQYQQGNFEAGFRLADLLLKGQATAADPARAFAIFTTLAQEGEVLAEHNLGVCHEYGNGTPVDYTQAEAWYRRAARHGSLPALFSLGAMHASDRILPRDDIEGLALLIEASARAAGDDSASRYILEHQPAQVKRLKERMTAGDIAQAKLRAAARAKTVLPAGQPEKE